MSAENPIDHEQALSWLSAYLDGELPPPEKALIEAHLALCDACSAELDILRHMQALMHGLPAVDPPAGFADGVMREIASEKTTGGSAPGRTLSLMPFLRKAAAVAAVVLIIRVGMHEWRNEPHEQVGAPQSQAKHETAVDVDRTSPPDAKVPDEGGATDRLRAGRLLQSGQARSAGADAGSMARMDSALTSRPAPPPRAPAPEEPGESLPLHTAADFTDSAPAKKIVVSERAYLQQAEEFTKKDAAAAMAPVRLAVRPHNREGVEAVIAAFRVQREGAPKSKGKAPDPLVETFAFREQAVESRIVRFAVRGEAFPRFLEELSTHAAVIPAVESEGMARDADPYQLRFPKENGLVMIEVTMIGGANESDEN